MTAYTVALILAIISFFAIWFGIRAIAIKTQYSNGHITSVVYHGRIELLYRLLVGISGGTTCAVVIFDINYGIVNKFFAAMSTAFL